MKQDEFAFFNQQLGTMLRDGIPLEGALLELCANLRRGDLRGEMEQLAESLKKGTPLPEALEARKLPEFYKRMVRVGVAGNDLPGVLLMLADYYQRVDSTWTRLKGLMVYPVIVLVAAFALSLFLSTTVFYLIQSCTESLFDFIRLPPGITLSLWLPPLMTGFLLLLVLAVLLVKPLRDKMRWWLPAFKEANLSQMASSMCLMLKNGNNLGDSLALIQQMEKNSPAGLEIAQWQTRLAAGRGKFSEMAIEGKAFPPLFVWLVGNSGEDLAGGFKRAADVYKSRAAFRTDTLLYVALPLATLILGGMILGQLAPVVRLFVSLMNGIGDFN